MMSIKTFAVAAALAVGTLGVTSKADAQVIYSGGTYVSPGVYYQSSMYPSSVYPASGAFYSSGYYPSYGSYNSSYYSPYSGGYYSNYYSPYSSGYGYSNVYNSGYYGRGAVYGGRRMWRW